MVLTWWGREGGGRSFLDEGSNYAAGTVCGGSRTGRSKDMRTSWRQNTHSAAQHWQNLPASLLLIWPTLLLHSLVKGQQLPMQVVSKMFELNCHINLMRRLKSVYLELIHKLSRLWACTNTFYEFSWLQFIICIKSRTEAHPVSSLHHIKKMNCIGWFVPLFFIAVLLWEIFQR